MSERILVFSAHPDDETLGVGGTIARHTQAGDPVSVVAFADGVGSRGFSGEMVKERHSHFRAACKVLGTEDVWIHQFADNRMDSVALLQVVQQMEIHIKRFQPTVVYSHWSGDLNVDHKVVHEATKVACRPQPGCTVEYLFFYEVPCSTSWGESFHPNGFVDITNWLDVKLEACKKYTDEMRDPPHPRSLATVENQARYRGAQFGVNAAEAFVVGRVQI